MKRLTFPVAMKLCAELWDWLSENPGETSKVTWPKWIKVRRVYGQIRNNCFACQLVGLLECDSCPMRSVWNCCHCENRKSPYQRWKSAKTPIGRARNARLIADGARRILAEYNRKKKK